MSVIQQQGTFGDGALMIGGQPVPAADGTTMVSYDPSTGEPLAQCACAGPVDIDIAIACARDALDDWSHLAPAERGRVLACAASAIRDASDELLRLDALDGGLPVRMGQADVRTAARYFEYYAGAADKLHGDTIPLGSDVVDLTLREPYGVCGIITPFNVPLQMIARSVAPALATGNSVVVKSAEQVPLVALALARTLNRAGIPPGVLNILPGGVAAGSHLAGHGGIDRMTFTGSLAAGVSVAAAAVQRMTPVTIEAGGKCPQIVFDDAHLEEALDAIVASALLSAGQVCSAGTRVLAQDGIASRLREGLISRARAIRCGPALDDPDMGPLISASQQQRVQAAIDTARCEGARVLLGGGPPTSGLGGYFVEPTILADVPVGAAAGRDEIFGPVLVLESFATVDEALALANGSPFGLVSGVWTRDLDTGMRAARELQFGQVFINNYGVGGGAELPFGGYKLSGIGREKGFAALLEYTQTKNVCVRIRD